MEAHLLQMVNTSYLKCNMEVFFLRKELYGGINIGNEHIYIFYMYEFYLFIFLWKVNMILRMLGIFCNVEECSYVVSLRNLALSPYNH